jgi:nucleotide-binding universal stress UspA family protein
MYKTMLVLLDGSELAEVVFKYARELSGRLSLDLELLHVCTPAESEQLPMRRAYMERMAEVLCAGAEELRSSLADQPVASCISARGTVMVGNPAEEILKYIDSHAVDLVLMSTHGHSGIKEWVDIGSVASKVLHASRVPVWLVPSELRDEIVSDTLPKRTLVVPLSGTRMSEAAIPHALNIARQRGADAEIVLVGVLDAGLISVSRARPGTRRTPTTRSRSTWSRRRIPSASPAWPSARKCWWACRPRASSNTSRPTRHSSCAWPPATGAVSADSSSAAWPRTSSI